MTDAEIMKGVKLCNGDLGNCKECPFDSIGKTCGIELAKAEIGLIERLQAENAALRERLDKAIEPPCERDDIFYRFFQYPAEMVEDIACGFRKEKDGELYVCSANSESWYNVKECEFSREAAEARLAELKGEKE